MRDLPDVTPLPPRRSGLPWIGAGVVLLRNPTEFFRRAGAELGDTFIVDAFGYRLFCVFSPAGVRRLYALAAHPGDVASHSARDARWSYRRSLAVRTVSRRAAPACGDRLDSKK